MSDPTLILKKAVESLNYSKDDLKQGNINQAMNNLCIGIARVDRVLDDVEAQRINRINLMEVKDERKQVKGK